MRFPFELYIDFANNIFKSVRFRVLSMIFHVLIHIIPCNNQRCEVKIFTLFYFPALAIAAWAAITLIARWNDFFWPLLYLRKSSKYTLMVTISLLPVSEGLSTPWPVILAGTTLVIIPIILLYLFLQRFQKSGMMAGAVKG